MLDRILMILLGPILLAQGKKVRNGTPFLPEPPGERIGVAGQGPLLRLLVVGDSSAAGVGATHQDLALLGQTVSRLAQNHTVEYRLEAKSGSTTRGTLRRLKRLEPETYDVAVTSLGANDSTKMISTAKFMEEQERLVKVLKEDFGVKWVVCSPLPPMHIFPAMPQPLRWVIGRKARSLNKVLGPLLASQPGCQFLDNNFSMDVQLMASDGFHPGPEAYEIWGEAMAQRIKEIWKS